MNFAAIDLATGGLLAGTLFFVVFAVIAYVAFRLLKRTAKAAFRMAVLVIILAIAVIGAISFFWLGSGTNSGKPRPSTQRSR